MRSSSSSGIGHDMVESLRASYQNPCLAARRRVPACAASAGHRRTCDHVKTSVGVAAVPYAARFGPLTAPQVAIGLRRARQARVRVDLLLCILRRCLRPNNELAGVRWLRKFEGGPLISSNAAVRSLPRVERTNRVPPWFRTGRGRLAGRESRPKQHEGLPPKRFSTVTRRLVVEPRCSSRSAPSAPPTLVYPWARNAAAAAHDTAALRARRNTGKRAAMTSSVKK